MAHDEREANRAAAEQVGVQRAAEQSEVVSALSQRRQRIDLLSEQAARLIPAALNACAERGYEGIVELTRKRKTVFGGYKDEKFGGYRLCTLMASAHGEEFPRETFLGSDGSIWPWAKDLDEYVHLVRRTEAIDGSNRTPASGHGTFSIMAFEKVVGGLLRLARSS